MILGIVGLAELTGFRDMGIKGAEGWGARGKAWGGECARALAQSGDEGPGDAGPAVGLHGGLPEVSIQVVPMWYLYGEGSGESIPKNLLMLLVGALGLEPRTR